MTDQDYIRRQKHNDDLWQDGRLDVIERHVPNDYESMPHSYREGYMSGCAVRARLCVGGVY